MEAKANNVFEIALQSWTEIDLPNVQRKLDEQGIELRSEQKASLGNRKELASKTKEFKKLEDLQKLNEMNLLLKMYQKEIDSLTTKQKKSEGFFFSFYRIIAEAPDPKPLLELSLHTVLNYQELTNLKDEISKLKDELTKRADYEVLKQRLLRNEQNSAELLASKLKAREEEFNALLDERETNWKIVEKQHQSQIEAYKSTIEELKTNNEVAALQLNSQKSQIDQTSANSGTSVYEMSILTREVETWKKRGLELEKRNEDLRKELSAFKTDSSKDIMQEQLADLIADMESENVILLANLKQAKEKLEMIAKEHESSHNAMSRELQQSIQENQNLKSKLDQRSDYEELKQELILMRQIQFGESEDHEDNAKNIDSLLIERNRLLTKELAELRAEHDTLVSQISSLTAQLQECSSRLDTASSLNARLENDLASVRDTNELGFNDNMSLISGIARPKQASRGGSIVSASTAEDSSILPIITKQRDRFRERNKELEEEARKQLAVMSELKRLNKQLQSDNEELYEKTRFMASMKGGQERTQRNQISLNRPFAPKANSKDLENPYQASYESKLHPIEQFRKREQERVNSRLSPVERLFIFVTRSVLATRVTRMLFLSYCLLLHLIVVFTTVFSLNLSTNMIPEVGLNESTGGVADANAHIVQEASI